MEDILSRFSRQKKAKTQKIHYANKYLRSASSHSRDILGKMHMGIREWAHNFEK